MTTAWIDFIKNKLKAIIFYKDSGLKWYKLSETIFKRHFMQMKKSYFLSNL